MSAIGFRRLCLIVAAFVLQTALLRAALPGSDEAPARPSLAGQLLVAAPWIGCRNGLASSKRFLPHAKLTASTRSWKSCLFPIVRSWQRGISGSNDRPHRPRRQAQPGQIDFELYQQGEGVPEPELNLYVGSFAVDAKADGFVIGGN
jgi:hypothetical protein